MVTNKKYYTTVVINLTKVMTNNLILIFLVVILCISSNNNNVVKSQTFTETISEVTQLSVNMMVYGMSDCSNGGTPSFRPDKIVSFVPGQCYVYATKSVKIMYDQSVPTDIHYLIYNSVDCTLPSLVLDTLIALGPTCQPLPAMVTDRYLVFKAGPPQSPPTESAVNYLYYEKTPLAVTCGQNRYYRSRTILALDVCTYNDYSGNILMGEGGDSQSIDILNDTPNCIGLPTKFYSECSTNAYNIHSAFKTSSVVRIDGFVNVLSYNAISVLNVDFGYNQKTNIFASVQLDTGASQSVYNPGYSYQISQNMTFTNIPTGFSGRLNFYQDGYDYLLNSIVAPISTTTFNLPEYPQMTFISPTNVYINTMNITYGSTGGFSGANVYKVIAYYASTFTEYTNCASTTSCYLNGLPNSTIVNVTVTVTNNGLSDMLSRTVPLAQPFSNFNFTIEPAFNSINLKFTWNGGFGLTNINVTRIDQNNMNTVTQITNDQYISFQQVSSVPTNYTFIVTAFNDGNQYQLIQNHTWFGDIIIGNITIGEIGTTTAKFYCDALNIKSSQFQVIIRNPNSSIYSVGSGTTGPIFMSSLVPGTTNSFTVSILEESSRRLSNTLSFTVTTYPTIYHITVLQTQKVNSVDNTTYLQIIPSVLGGSPNFPITYEPVSPTFPYGIIWAGNMFIAPNLTTPSGTFFLNIKATQQTDEYTASFGFDIYNFPVFDFVNITSGHENVSLSWGSHGGIPDSVRYKVSMYLQNNNPSVKPTTICQDSLDTCTITKLTSNTLYSFDITLSSFQFDSIVETRSIQTLTYPNNVTCQDPNSTIDCSGYGQCINGTCLCDKNRIGIYCETQTTDQGGNSGNVNPNPNTPEIVISNKNIFYDFVISEIREVDLDDQIIKTLDLTTLNWTQSNTTTTNNQSFIQNNWIYSTVNNNTNFQSINITFLQYKQGQENNNNNNSKIPITFANQLFYLDVGSIKYTIDIGGWNFNNRLNTLQLITNITQPQVDGGCGSTDVDFNNNIVTNATEFTSVFVGQDQVVVGKLINRALLDDIPRKISYKVQQYQNDQQKQLLSIITLIPNFNSLATLDPQFDLLINTDGGTDSCTNESNTWKIIVGAVVGGIGALALGAGAVIFYQKAKTKKIYDKKLKKLSTMAL
ncbi:hypothetical protein DFA_10410 [Cavenderia fasciculata]|uniref:ComC supersandwich domain-containing protein n=1 Tax=Cavenderia fasciculata TaxID=261658 RepID=F4QA49_CACFS|nr:uncharacterized protein DFA_10410 [Cavenderia fasciculata]EGG15568.1 hypothetical protein DFA_10410 [Cavenderia fasciculata]|eukprot:XP_004354310.1 hypothetical protein DFA_10410 [Cavenderia fasciculata]